MLLTYVCECRGAVWNVYQCKAKSLNKPYVVKIHEKQVVG